jgi:hypothetical protein
VTFCRTSQQDFVLENFVRTKSGAEAGDNSIGAGVQSLSQNNGLRDRPRRGVKDEKILCRALRGDRLLPRRGKARRCRR